MAQNPIPPQNFEKSIKTNLNQFYQNSRQQSKIYSNKRKLNERKDKLKIVEKLYGILLLIVLPPFLTRQ